MPNYFDGIIGLETTKRQLSFYIEGYKDSGFFHNILMAARFGSGKSTLARKVAANLIDKDTKKPKKTIFINCVTLRSVKQFVDQIFLPHISGQKSTLILDEIDFANQRVIEYLHDLLAFDPETKNKTATLTWDGNKYPVDFVNGLTVLATTTNIESLPKAFVNRFKQLTLPDYKSNDMAQMLVKYCPDVRFANGVEKEIIDVTRFNPRNVALRLSNDITSYIKLHKKTSFGKNEWADLRRTLNIRPLGIDDNEIKLLRMLNDGPLQLNAISMRLNLDTSTVRRSVESFLRSEGYINVDGPRFITDKGRQLLLDVEEWERKNK